jgi:hypothetical protein
MADTLRPMNLGEILDRTFHIYRSRFLLFALISAIPALVMMALQFANRVSWHLYLPDTKRIFLSFTMGDFVSILAFYQVSLFVHILVWPCSARMASKSCLGEQSTLKDALLGDIARWRGWLSMAAAVWATALLLPELLMFGLLAGVGELLWDVLKLDSRFLDQSFPFVFSFAAWAFVLTASAPFLFAVPAWTLEELSVRRALRRSWILSRRGRTRIIFARFMAPILGWLLNSLLVLAPFLLFTLVFRGFGGRMFFYRHALGINLVSAAVSSSLVGPIYPIALTLFYYDQRIRHEGYDIERMMDDAGLNATATPPASGEPVTPAIVEESRA